MDNIRKGQLDRMWERMGRKVERVVRHAWQEGRDVGILLREHMAQHDEDDGDCATNVVRNLKFDDAAGDDGGMLPFNTLIEALERDDCPGTVGDGRYLRIKYCLTVDSGSAAFVMPEDWIPGVEKTPSSGSQKGQKLIGAAGKTAPNTGQTNTEFATNGGQYRRCTFQCSKVSKILACVAGRKCDTAKPSDAESLSTKT